MIDNTIGQYSIYAMAMSSGYYDSFIEVQEMSFEELVYQMTLKIIQG